MPLRLDPDGTLVLAGADPEADLSAAGRPARLVLAPADAVDAVLGAAPRHGDDVFEWEAAMDWRAPFGRRRLWPWALLALALLALVAGAAVLALRSAADGPPAAVAQADLPEGVLVELTAEAVPRSRALAAACDGSPAVVLAPLDEVPCALRRSEPATVAATILLAPGGGCLSAQRARALAAELRRRPAQPAPDSQALAVRPDRGGACISADPTTLRAGLYPLTRRALVIVRPQDAGSAETRRLVAALQAAQARAPVTTLVTRRAVS